MQDGSRLVIKANHNHTVGDIYAHVKSKKPGNFELRTSFPTLTLTNMDQTIAEADLLNAAIIHTSL
jgi:hypothetical protein